MLAELTDVALRLKEAFEDKNMEGFTSLFAQNARINSLGRFYTVPELTSRLKEMFPFIEQPALDIVQIEESSVAEKQSFVTYLVEVSWINPKTWEEHLERGAMSLELTRVRKAWQINGFTFARRPPAAGLFDDIKPPGPGTTSPLPRGFGLDSLFSFWY